MNATMNTFPPFHSMNSPRGWILAAIVLLHFGFFLALSSGMGVRIVEAFRPPAVLVVPESEPEPLPPEPPVSRTVDIEAPVVFVPEPELRLPQEPEAHTAPRAPTTEIPPVTTRPDQPGSAEPVITAPQIDPRVGLSEPLYPSSAIRAGHTGTVLLSVYVLENGRVGDVRLDQTSGYPKLDESAQREARRWRLKPGMRDGVPVAMWKQIPVTFQLQGAGSRRF